MSHRSTQGRPQAEQRFEISAFAGSHSYEGDVASSLTPWLQSSAQTEVNESTDSTGSGRPFSSDCSSDLAPHSMTIDMHLPAAQPALLDEAHPFRAWHLSSTFVQSAPALGLSLLDKPFPHDEPEAAARALEIASAMTVLQAHASSLTNHPHSRTSSPPRALGGPGPSALAPPPFKRLLGRQGCEAREALVRGHSSDTAQAAWSGAALAGAAAAASPDRGPRPNAQVGNCQVDLEEFSLGPGIPIEVAPQQPPRAAKRRHPG